MFIPFFCILIVSFLQIVDFQMKLGWTEAALIAGAKDVGLSPSIVGSLSRKEAALVEVHYRHYLCLV